MAATEEEEDLEGRSFAGGRGGAGECGCERCLEDGDFRRGGRGGGCGIGVFDLSIDLVTALGSASELLLRDSRSSQAGKDVREADLSMERWSD